MGRYKQYYLQVTAGPTYDPSTHELVHVNAEKPLRVSHASMDLDLTVRVSNYRGVPVGSPASNAYLDSSEHSKDQYSIAFNFVPKEDINGDSIIFGNDLDHPVRDKLPPGYKQAFKIMTWFIDSSLWGDPSADTPYMYGPILSCLNSFNIGDKTEKGELPAWDGSGPLENASTKDESIPSSASARKKYFLEEDKRDNFVFEKGRAYGFDFFNPFLDFNEFALKLPGFSIDILKYWNKSEIEKEHRLRYVMKDRDTGRVYFVIVFTLLKRIPTKPDGKPIAEEAAETEADEAESAASEESEPEGEMLTEKEQVERGLIKPDPPQAGIIRYMSKPHGGVEVGYDEAQHSDEVTNEAKQSHSKKTADDVGPGSNGPEQVRIGDHKDALGHAIKQTIDTSADDVD